MRDEDKPTRSYDAARRREAAERRRQSVVESARSTFERRGWSGATVREVGEAAQVSVKTVEALFGTKAALLRAALEYAIRGDLDPTPMPQRAAVRRMEEAADAAAMLDLHAAHLREVNERSARIAWVVEQAAAADDAVAAVWRQLNENRSFGVRWAAALLLEKPGRRRGLRRDEAEAIFWVALDWGTFRTLVDHAGLSADGYEEWLRRYYATMLLARPPLR